MDQDEVQHYYGIAQTCDVITLWNHNECWKSRDYNFKVPKKEACTLIH